MKMLSLKKIQKLHYIFFKIFYVWIKVYVLQTVPDNRGTSMIFWLYNTWCISNFMMIIAMDSIYGHLNWLSLISFTVQWRGRLLRQSTFDNKDRHSCGVYKSCYTKHACVLETYHISSSSGPEVIGIKIECYYTSTSTAFPNIKVHH